MVKEHQDNRTRDNLKQIEDMMRKKKQGDTLGEKIEKHLEKVKKKNVVSIIGDSFYKPHEENSIHFWLRRTNLQREDGRTLNIDDEIEVEEAKMRAIQEEEAKRDLTFDEFQERFLAHIDGTAPNEREAHESEEEVEEKKKSDKQGTTSKRGTDGVARNSSHHVNDTGSVEMDRKSQASKKTAEKKSSVLDASRMTTLNKTNDSFRYETPDSCLVSMMKKTMISKLENKYLLTSHPYPKIEGEMIIFKAKKDDQEKGEDVIVYRDFSLRKRIETVPKPPTNELRKKKVSAAKGAEPKEEVREANLQCLEVDINEPLNPEEWGNFINVINETQGMGWFQVLPVDQKSSVPYQFNMMHVLPQAKIPVKQLPLDIFISNHVSFLRKKERSGEASGAVITTATAGRQLTAREELEELAIQQGLLMIPEFQFDHCLFQLGPENFVNEPALQFKEIYQRCATFLRFQSRPNIGVTVILTPKWFFMAILTQPYSKAPNGNPAYLDGFDFAGLVSLQTTSNTWPATAGLIDQTISILQAYANSTQETKIAIDDEEDDIENINNSNVSGLGSQRQGAFASL